MNRPDGPHNAPPIARPGDVDAPDVEALRAQASRELARQRPAGTSTPDAPDPGKVLARLPRPDGSELRVSLHTYEGRPFVRVAPWASRDGGRRGGP